MQNYKVEVQNHSEAMEAQDLFLKMGFKKSTLVRVGYQKYVIADQVDSTGEKESRGAHISFVGTNYKKITIAELREMVVLKRNDVGDATHAPSIGYKQYHASNGDVYQYLYNGWNFSHNKNPIQNGGEIDKPVVAKEYLVKTDTGYVLQVLSDFVDGHNVIVEVPKDAMSYWECDRTSVKFFSKIEKGSHFYHYLNKNSKWALWNDADFKTFEMKWQRESLNNQVASAEQARQEQAQVRELSECDLIDSGKLIIGGFGESFPVGLEHHKFIQPEGFSEGGFIPKLNHGAPVGLLHHGFSGFTQPEELPFVSDNAWNKQIGGDHYKKLAIQPMEYALQNKLDYAQANVVKYVTRHADKNGKQDLLKAIHNIELMIAHYYSDQE